MLETWKALIEYPGYAVSNYGHIMNTHTDLVKNPSTNQQGILMVNFSINQKQLVRSVALIVANHFLEPPKEEHFDTPIHLDGDRTNCHVYNLAWRPRWFAVKYHQQFNEYERENRHGFKTPVEITKTGEIFPNSWQAAVKYGLLDFEIFMATLNRTYVFPTGQVFRVLEV